MLFHARKLSSIRGKSVTVHLPFTIPQSNLPGRPAPLATDNAPGQEKARRVAELLEATFISEMLKSAGFGAQENSFSGSAGEDQFASFHRDAIARKIAAGGGIGLAEQIVRHIAKEADNDQ
ncbi:MAG: rod-binding protein [Pseudomonadota bacterium]